MKATSRRIYLYWVLLFLPTLGVGVGAFYLLNREEGRLLARAGQLEEARRTALRARAQLAAENAELIISDLETGILDTLATVPVSDPDPFLRSLERANPLVHFTFRCDSSGALLRPRASDEDEKARGFHRRFSAALREAPFVHGARQATNLPAVVPSFSGELSKKDASVSQVQEGSNYALNVQNARRDVQSLAKISSERARSENVQAAQYSATIPSRRAKSSASVFHDSASNSMAAAPAAADRLAEKELGSSAPVLSVSEVDRSGDHLLLTDKASLALSKGSPATVFKSKREEVAPPAFRELSRGWYPVLQEHRLCLLGYVQMAPDSAVFGLELDLMALVSRLGAALPPDLARGEGLCLRDERGRIMHQAGTIPSADESANSAKNVSPSASVLMRVPLNASLLPGWTVEAYLLPAAYSSGSSSGFLLMGSLLAATLVIALLSGGFLLLQQARGSELEALRKTSFVANVSHELKTPLTTIRLYADLLEQGRVPSEERRAEYLRTIGRESERLSRLVNNVLDFSRLERGLRAFTLTRLDPAAELRRICDVNTPRLAEAGLRLSLVLSDERLFVDADRDALGQILLNLLDNAVKYAAEGGELRVSLSAGPAGRVLISVADRGPGVSASERERIFLKFHRIDQSLTAEKSGAGLGLSIARQLARAMQGDLRCLPHEGGGALFELSLPALPKEVLV